MPFFNDSEIQATARFGLQPGHPCHVRVSLPGHSPTAGWGWSNSAAWGSSGGVRGVVPGSSDASPPPAGRDTRAGVTSSGLADGGEVSLQLRQVQAAELHAKALVHANEMLLIIFHALCFLDCTNGAGSKIRTRGLMITNQLLYQLSYASINCFRLLVF